MVTTYVHVRVHDVTWIANQGVRKPKVNDGRWMVYGIPHKNEYPGSLEPPFKGFAYHKFLSLSAALHWHGGSYMY